MDLTFTDEQLALRDTVARWMDVQTPPHEITQWYKAGIALDRNVYASAARSGFLGLMIPEAYGGSGAGAAECGVLMEELGKGPVPGPYFTSGVLAAQLVLCLGTEDQRQGLLPPICGGEDIVAVALSDDGHDWSSDSVSTSATLEGSEVVLNGTKQFVHELASATTVLCAAKLHRGDDSVFVLVRVPTDAAGVQRQSLHGLGHELSRLTLTEVRLSAAHILGGAAQVAPDGGWSAIESAYVSTLPLLAAYKAGALQHVMTMTNEYTSLRVLFGQPIGRFQRVQDHCIELSIRADAARWVTYEALWRADGNDIVGSRTSAHEAKAVASDSYCEGVDFAHKVFAGPGTDFDHPLMPHSVVSRTLYPFLGSSAFHRSRMVDLILGDR